MSYHETFQGEGRELEGNHGEDAHKAERLAAYLADRLDDWKSYGFFLAVARRLPREVVLDALTQALDIPRRDIRRSRGACFTAAIRRYFMSRNSP